jgi:CheY-like chemotaxis protein
MERVAGRLDGIHVLLVDDNEDARYILERVLHHHGALVITAANAGAALAVMEQVRPHVIITDMSMPGMDGLALLARLHELPGQGERPTPVIALTAFPADFARRRALAAGFQTYLVKPVDPGVVVAEVERLAQSGGAPVDPNQRLY